MPNRSMQRFDRVLIVDLISAGHTKQDVADRLNVTHTTVSKVLGKNRETENMNARPHNGRPHITIPLQDRLLQLTIPKSPTSTARNLRYDFS